MNKLKLLKTILVYEITEVKDVNPIYKVTKVDTFDFIIIEGNVLF